MLDDIVNDLSGLSFDELSRLAELIPKLILGVVAVAYVAGFTIINFCLARYGLFSPGLLKGEYVLAGATWLGFLAVAYSATVTMWDDLRSARYHLGGHRWLRALGRGLFGLWYLFYLPSWALRATGIAMDWSDPTFWIAEVVVIATPVALLGIRQALWEAYQEYRSDRHTITAPTRHDLVQSAGGMLLVLALYGYCVYPLMPQVIGGGRLAIVRVVFTAGDEALKQQVVHALGPGPTYSLVAESPEWIILGDGGNRRGEMPWARRAAVRLRHSDIAAIVSDGVTTRH